MLEADPNLPVINRSGIVADLPELSASTVARDALLVAALRARSFDALGEAYDHYGRLVFVVALRIVGDRQVAEEVTQDAFLRCWNGIERYQPSQGTFASWLLSIARHRAIDELRSRRNTESNQSVPFDETFSRATHDPGDDAETRGDVRSALAQLPTEQRRVIDLVYWTGMSRVEVAEHLKVPLGTVHTRLRLGMAKLRHTLRQLVEEP
ncbi:MAG: sigma-70 family RNA polymerase sigma factor [Herpetosiphon sp.]